MSILDRLIAHWDTAQHVAAQAPPPAGIPAAAAYKAPVIVPPRERYWWCRGCDVKWQGTDPACWCCGQVAA